jgi:Glu-tRNA(Gln) amidotransferase subunit E-like FAD-binding protein
MAYRKKPNKDPEQTIATIQEQLELTDVQVERIQPIVPEQSEKRRELFKKYRPQGLSAMREEMQKLRSEMDAQLAEILSDDQIEKYQMLQNQRREQMNQKYRSRDSRSFN